jgi:hypothetical protein
VEDAHESLVIAGSVVSLVLVLVELYDNRVRPHIEHKVGPVQMALDPFVVNDRLVGVPSLEVFLHLRLTGLEPTLSVWKKVRCASSAIFLGVYFAHGGFATRVLYINHSTEFMIFTEYSILFYRKIEYWGFSAAFVSTRFHTYVNHPFLHVRLAKLGYCFVWKIEYAYNLASFMFTSPVY